MKNTILTAISLILSVIPAWANLGAMRSKPASDLSAYCSPASTPASARISFMPDGKSYVERSADFKSLVVKDIETGKEVQTLFDITHTRETTLSDFEGFILSPDASQILIYRNSEYIYRRSFEAEYYVYEVRSRLLRPLSKTFKKQRDPLFSPDSRMVAFVAENNIYAAKLDYQTEVAVTTDGSANILNGATDWTYEEEFGITSLMAWAPDNLTFCYVRTNQEQVPMYTLPIYAGTCNPQEQYYLYPGIQQYKYPVAGQPNSTVSVQSYDVETRKTKTLDIPGNPYYIPNIGYGPKETQLMVSTLNRDQNHYEIFVCNPKSTVCKSVYLDESKAWIEEMCYDTLYLGPNSFVVASDKDGFTRFYEYSYTGSKIRDISSPGVDATKYYGADAKGFHYFCAAAPTPLDRTIYRLDPLKGLYKAISPEGGCASATFAPTCSAIFMNYSNKDTAPKYSLNRADGKELRVLQDNSAYTAKVAGLKASKEFITIPGEDGLQFNAYIIKPKDFSASKKYPVIMSQYSGPGSQSVLNNWSFDWQDYYASQGYIILCLDGRGTGGRGAKFRTAVYKDLGHYETIDQVAGARYAATLPYVDGSRIGIYGWSFGGYEALMCASADDCPFAAAVSVAPVTDWRFYDTVYTERFMLTPQQNDKGYNSSSALQRALHLACPLLIMYGTADDNVHPANSLQYVSSLQNAGILCDMFVFPQKNHSIYGCNARAVVYARMFEFFNSKLK